MPSLSPCFSFICKQTLRPEEEEETTSSILFVSGSNRIYGILDFSFYTETKDAVGVPANKAAALRGFLLS